MHSSRGRSKWPLMAPFAVAIGMAAFIYYHGGGFEGLVIGAGLGFVLGIPFLVKWRRHLGEGTGDRLGAPGASAQQIARPPTIWMLLRRSHSLRAAGFLFFFAFVGAVFYTISLAVAKPDDAEQVSTYGLVVLAIFGFGAYKLWTGLREVAEWARVLRRGVATEGVVTGVHERSGPRLSMGWFASYAYTDRAGKRHAGESGLSPRQAQLWRSGDRCAVMFDPGNPASSVWVAHRPE